MSNLPGLSGHTILQLIPELAAGGAERTVLEMAEAIVKAGGRALVASSGGRLVQELEALGGEFVEMDAASKNPLIIFRNANQLAGLIADQGIDLIHARSRAPAWSAWRAAQATNIPFVTTYHGAYSGTSGPKKLYNSVMAKGDLVIANSRWIGAHVQNIHNVPEDRIIIIPRGVDFDRFDPDVVTDAQITALRHDWGLADENKRLILLLPARLTAWKGQKLALEALNMLSREEQDQIVLVFAGDAQGRTSYVEELEQMVSTYGLVEATRIVGHCADMPTALLAADIVLAPSLRPEAFGRTAIEAAAMGCPVIAAEHGGAKETVIDGETGAHFSPGDASALAAAIRSLISIGQPARVGMGKAGQSHAKTHFSKRGLQTATLSVYTALIARGISRRA